MKYFPLFHQLKNTRCLIVGGGNVALRRAKLLQGSGAIVDVVAPNILPELELVVSKASGHSIKQMFDKSQLNKGYTFVIAATDDKAVNKMVAEHAKANGILVNVADNPDACDFTFPAILERSPLTVAISNNGASPVLSRLLKQQIDAYLPKRFDDLARFVGENRERVKQSIDDESTRKSFWENVLQSRIAQSILAGKSAKALQTFEHALAAPEAFIQQGEVYLIGAGPGDPELLTLRALRLLQQAQVVLHDRLVSPEIMALVNKNAELVYVGKQRSEHSVSQQDINQRLADYAKQGKRVARLKGGDPFIFGRGGEEIELLAEQGVNFQVVPGVSAANGCSSYAGIPLTHRDYAQSVQFITGQLKDGKVYVDWPELVSPSKTLVFYMGLKSLPFISEGLISHGMDENMPAALVEKGTTKDQKVWVSTLADINSLAAKNTIESPTLLIVGKVVTLADKLSWFE